MIAGGGVAALEAALALRALAGSRVSMTMVAPEDDFVYRPLRVREPFAGPEARHYDLAVLARGVGVDLKRDAFRAVDTVRRRVQTERGGQLRYDALLLAMGARMRPAFEHALTLDDRGLDEQMHGLVRDAEEGYVNKLAFISPDPSDWPLPMYELALMIRRRAWEMGEKTSVTIVTAESAPLALFGAAASEAVNDLLTEAGIVTITGTRCMTPRPNEVKLLPSGQTLSFDRVVAMPELIGPVTPGLPKRSEDAFIPIDSHCRVPGAEGVFAAGDATDFAVKHGGLAAQQADVAAASIAAMAGAAVEPVVLQPVIHGMLLGGRRPLYMTAYIGSEHGPGSESLPDSTVSDTPTWAPAEKIAARHLGPYLESFDRAGV